MYFAKITGEIMPTKYPEILGVFVFSYNIKSLHNKQNNISLLTNTVIPY